MSKYANLGEPDGGERLFQFEPNPTWPEKLPPKNQWEPLELIIFEGEGADRRKTAGLADFISGGVVHILSERAADALSDLWEKYGDLYLLKVRGIDQNFYGFHPTNVVDCLDIDRSVLKGAGGNGARFSIALEFVFFEEKVGDSIIFTTPDHPHGPIYVTDVFKERVKKAKLKGLELRAKFFDPKPWKSG